MAEEAPSSSTASPPEESPLSANISIVSPSVNTPMSFPALPASTTIAQLKQKVRDVLDSKPSNEQQRLIHQGKLLSRESETLLEIFGEQKLRDSDQLIIHLVITDHINRQPSSTQPTAPRGQTPAIPAPNATPFGTHPQPTPHNQHHGHHHLHSVPARFSRPPAQAHSPLAGQGFGIPAPGNQTPAQLVAQQQQLLQQYMNQLNNRPPVNQGHHVRASMGLHGVQDAATNAQAPLNNNGQGRNSAHPDFQPYVREGVGPNGEVYRVTMNSAVIAPSGHVFPVNLQNLQQQGNPGTPVPGASFSANDVQNMLQHADASQATSMMTNAMHRSASGASLANFSLSNQRQPMQPQRQPIQPPGVTVPRRPGSTVPLSRTATPDQMRTSSYGSTSAPPNPAMRSSAPHQAEVYILNSPTGPRALLINNHSDVYYTPAARYHAPLLGPLVPSFAPAWLQPQPQPQPRQGAGTDTAQAQPAAAPAQQQDPQQGNIRVNLYQGPAGQQRGQQQQGAAMQPLAPVDAQLHPGNPEGGVAAALIAAVWPHLWLLIRLTVFVWWFASSDTSWTRWCTMMFVATAVFLINTGLLNGMANNLFHPVRQHLEGLMPLAGPNPNRNGEGNANNAPAQNGGNNHNNNNQTPQPRQQQGEPDPAQIAARLVAQRRNENASWVMEQVRRLERAGLLFLASIAPGVAERHIAHLEAEARAERERREAEERAERERREADERAAAEATAAVVDSAAAPVEGDGGNNQHKGESSGSREQQPHQQPVAAI